MPLEHRAQRLPLRRAEGCRRAETGGGRGNRRQARYDGRPLANWVPTVVADLVATCDPVQVILLGSVARGEDGPDSDIDVLVVLPEVDRARRHRSVARLRRAVTAAGVT